MRTFPLLPHAHMATDWIILDVTSALKSNATPRADESYRYREASLSQQAWCLFQFVIYRSNGRGMPEI